MWRSARQRARPDRPERLRQEHFRQRRNWRVSAERRQDKCSAARSCPRRDRTTWPATASRAHFRAIRLVRRTFGDRQRHGRVPSAAQNADFSHICCRPVRPSPRRWRFARKAMALLEFVGIAERAHDHAQNLSYGQQRLLEIARALAARPQLLMLDEPAAGVNPTELHHLARIIRDIKAAGVTLLVIEHHMELIMGISDVISVFDFGQKIAEGSAAAVRAERQSDRGLSGRRRTRRGVAVPCLASRVSRSPMVMSRRCAASTSRSGRAKSRRSSVRTAREKPRR